MPKKKLNLPEDVQPTFCPHCGARKYGFRVTVKKAPLSMETFGAYLQPSVRQTGKVRAGTVLFQLDATLYDAAESGVDWHELAADTITHELLHAVQDFLTGTCVETAINEQIEAVRMSYGEDQVPSPLVREVLEWRKIGKRFLAIKQDEGEAGNLMRLYKRCRKLLKRSE